MAGNAENQYAAGSSESNPGGAWGAAPPIMHSWCLQSDEPASGSESKARMAANDADDDCGFDLNLGLSLGGGGGKSSTVKSKSREKEKEVLLDRDAFRDKGERGDGAVASKEVDHGVMFKAFKTEQDEANPSRVQQHSFWKDLDRPGDGKVPAPVVEAGRWAGENSVAEDSKMFAQHMWQALQGKAAQPEHQRLPLSPQDEASLIKELQGLPPQAVATAAAWARVVAQGGFPMQILEAIKDGVDPGMSRGMALQRSMSISKSHSSGPHSEVNPDAMSPPTSNAALERSDSDVSKNMQIVEEQHRQLAMSQQQEIVEQQRKRDLQTQKRQEARRKRKALLEGAKSKKSSKKDDERPGSVGPGGSQGSRSGIDTPPSSLRRTSSLQLMSKETSVSMGSSPPDSQDAGGASSNSAFRRPASTSWLHNWDGNHPAKPKAEKEGRVESGEQMVEIRRALERARERGAKDRGEDSGGHAESNSEPVRKVGSPDVVQLQRMDLDSNAGTRQAMNRQEGSNLGPPSGMMNGPIDPAWIQKIMEMQMMMAKFPQMQRRGEGGAERAAPMAEPDKPAKRGRASSQTSSGGTESSGGQDEKSGNGVRVVHSDADALSSPMATSTAGESCSNPPAAMMPSVSNAMAMANMAFPQGGGFPMMPGAFPFPLPVPPGGGPGGVPFSVPFPFPYLMQFAPNPAAAAGDANIPEQHGHSNMPTPFQIALPAGFNPPFQMQAPEGGGPAVWPSTVVRPHATPPESPPRAVAAAKPSQSTISRDDDKHNPRGAKGKEHARSRNPSPGRELPAQSLVKSSSMGSGAFNRLRPTGAPATSLPPSQFGLSRSKSDAVTLRREGSVGSAFAAPAEHPPTNSVPSESATPSAPQPEQSTAATEEGARRPQPTGMWRQGSLPSFEGIAGQEAASLRLGVAPGVNFGGTGTPPDLPWVTCNGTISGVLYRVEKGQVRIVCACHGRHMTPAEFVQHAGCGEIPNPEKAIVVGPFTVMSQQPASAQA